MKKTHFQVLSNSVLYQIRKLNLSIFILFLSLLTYQSMFGQQATCNSFTYEEAIIAVDKKYALKKEQTDAALLTKAKSGHEKSAAPGILTIPVMVHVVHLVADATPGVNSNLSTQQVNDAIAFLNGVYQGMAKHQTGGSDEAIDIAFCLAGITNHADDGFSNLVVETGDNPGNKAGSIKNAYGKIEDYPRTDFMNIWVVKSICGNSSPNSCALNGYSTLAPAHGSWYDGIVIEAGLFNGYGLAHEVGHYLNLKHTFGPFDDYADCTNDNCNVDNDCVCDTRPDGTLFTCETTNFCMTDVKPNSPFLSEGNDPTGNIMDYGDCFSYFTIGQRDRMRSAIEDIRGSLLSNTGACCVPVMQAAFTYQFFNNNQEIQLNGTTSQGLITSYLWEINGNEYGPYLNPITGTIPFPNVVEICLTVEGSGEYCQDKICKNITGAPVYDGCQIVCNGEFDALNLTNPLSNVPFNVGQIPCWTCSLGSPSYSIFDVGGNPDFGSAALVYINNNNTEAVRGFTDPLMNGKNYLVSMYKANGKSDASNSCSDIINPNKIKAVIDVDTDNDSVLEAFYPNDCGSVGDQSPIPSSAALALDALIEADYSSNGVNNFRRLISCFTVPMDGNSYKDLILLPFDQQIIDNQCGSAVAYVSRVELVKDDFMDFTDIEIQCGREMLLGEGLNCTLSDVIYKWEKEIGPNVWEDIATNLSSPIFNLMVNMTVKLRLTRVFVDPNNPNWDVLQACPGLPLTKEFTITVTGHSPTPLFTHAPIDDCQLDVKFFSTEGDASVGHKWSIGQTDVSTDSNPLLTFSGPGEYLVTHTVINPCGTFVYSETVMIECGGNCDCPANSYFLSGGLFSSYLQSNGGSLPDNPTTPINVIISGQISFDIPYHFLDGSNICMGNNSLISVAPGGDLTLTGTYVRGCDQMWAGIYIGGGRLKTEKGNLNRSRIEDALTGITEVIANDNLSLITGTDFNANGTHIRISSGVHLGAISDCRFLGDGPFLSSTITKTQYGIFLDKTNAPFVNIGSIGSGSNIFDKIGTGIKADESNFVLRNSQFTNILDANLFGADEGHAVYATGNGQIFRQGVSEVCNIPDPQVTISNCNTGMYFSGMNVGAIKNNIFDVRTGIVVENGQNRRITICGNKVTCNGTGIALKNTDPAQFIRIQANDINVGPYAIPSTGGVSLKRSAISIKEAGAPQPNAVISGNTNINMFSSLEGISLYGGNGYVVANNAVNATHTQQAATYFGYNFTNSPGLTVRCNNANGNYNGINGNGTTSAGSTGIRVTASTDISYLCNTLSNTRNGLQFDMGCDGSLIKQTSFKNHFYGLQYFATAKTGRQPDNPTMEARHGNRWYNIGSSSNGARHESTNSTWRNQSKFTVSSGPGSTSSYYYPTNPSPSDWIGVLGGSNYSCLNDFGGCPVIQEACCSDLRGSDENIALGQVQPGVYNAETQWMSDFYLYQKLYEHPNLIESGSVFQSFYTNKSNTPIGSFVPVRKGMKELFVLDNETATTMNGYEQTMDENMGEIANIDEQLPTATGNNLQQLLAQRAAAVLDLETANSNFQNLASNVATTRNNKADNLLSSNNAILVTQVYEQNEKTVNTVFLRTIGKGVNSLTENQKADLQSIANQCPYTGGTAVFRARQILSTLDGEVYYDDNALCQPQAFGTNPPLLATNPGIGAKVFPNPAKDRFIVELDQPLSVAGNLKLYNAFGQEVLVQSLQPESASFDFDVNTLTGGIYLLSIKEGKNTVYTTRLVLIK